MGAKLNELVAARNAAVEAASRAKLPEFKFGGRFWTVDQDGMLLLDGQKVSAAVIRDWVLASEGFAAFVREYLPEVMGEPGSAAAG